jgi:predicted aconitase
MPSSSPILSSGPGPIAMETSWMSAVLSRAGPRRQGFIQTRDGERRSKSPWTCPMGRMAGTAVAVISGLDDRADEDRLRALGATAASSGAVGLFHVAGVTPEAATVDQALDGGRPERVVSVGASEIGEALAGLGSSSQTLGAVSIGTPHASLREIESLAAVCAGRRTTVPFYVNTGRDVLEQAESSGAADTARDFGATFVTDTCTYITPIIGDVKGSVMTNSGKWAYYAPGNLGVDVVMGGLSDCVESAVRGDVVATGRLE